MNKSARQIIAVSLSIAVLIVAYFGSYLPMVKSLTFISTMRQSGGVRTVQDLEQLFSVPLDYPSPIGQEELVRNLASTIAGTLGNISDPAVIKELVRYVESYYKPIIDRGKGMSFGQNLYLLGLINETAYLKTNDKKYLDAASAYFKKAYELGPKRPQSLYGLLDVYKAEGNIEAFKKIADQLLSQWPNDERSKAIISAVLNPVPAAAKK